MNKGIETEGWTSGNNDIEQLIKDSDGRLQWVPFDRLKDIKQIGEGGFAKVYSATWINGRKNEVALKRLNGSQNMSADYLNEVCFVLSLYTCFFCWLVYNDQILSLFINLFNFNINNSLKFIGSFVNIKIIR